MSRQQRRRHSTLNTNQRAANGSTVVLRNPGYMQFSLSSTVTPPHVDLTVDGELDIFTARQVSRAISQALWTGGRHVRLDVAGVTFVDASALGVLARARDLMRSCAGSLEVVSYSPAFLRLCVLTGLVSLTLPAEGRAPELAS